MRDEKENAAVQQSQKSAPDLPRVLVLSDEIPQTVFAGGIILHRLFSGYGEQPEAADREAKGQKDQGLEARGERREGGDFERKHFGNSNDGPRAKLFVIGPKPHPEARLLDCPYREMNTPLRRLEFSRFSVWKRSLQAMGVIPLTSHAKIMRTLGGFKPEVVVSVMQGTPFMCLAARTARKLRIPLILIVHDLNEEFEKVHPWARGALCRVNRRVYRSAARRLCVSPEMAAFLERRYGVAGEVMYPNRSEELQPRPLAMSETLRAEVAVQLQKIEERRL